MNQPAVSEHVCPLPHFTDPDREREVGYGLRICFGHARSLPDRFTDVGRLWQELETQLETRTTASNIGRVSGTPTVVGIRLNADAVEVRAGIEATMRSVCRRIVTQRRIQSPHLIVPAMTVFLSRHAAWLAAQDSVVNMWHVLFHDPDAAARDARMRIQLNQAGKSHIADRVDTRALAIRAHGLLQPVNRRQADLGVVCPQDLDDGTPCEGNLVSILDDVSTLLPAKVSCPECRTTWAPHEFVRLGRLVGKLSLPTG